jgi:orotidine-5'-phosphate decarboxylase
MLGLALMITFSERLAARVAATGSAVCMGIDPRPEAHPSTHPDRFEGDPAKVARAVVRYFQEILEVNHDLLACVKPQAAFFERLGIPGLIALAQLIADAKRLGIPVLFDGKRGDIGSTAEAYADAYLDDGVFSSDALTVHPYLGLDTLEPFFAAAETRGRGVFVLVKTSNPGSGDLQDLELAAGGTVASHLAARLTERAARNLDRHGLSPIGAVVAATHPDHLRHLRGLLPHSWILVPGYGAQGGTADGIAAAARSDGLGALISASRSLTYHGDGRDVIERSRAATEAMHGAVAKAIQGVSR